MDINELQADFFKAMAHPVRMKILNSLREKNCCVSDVVGLVKEDQPQVSRCLAELKKAGLVLHEKKGKHSCYRIKSKEVYRLLEITEKIIKSGTNEVLSAFNRSKKKGEI